MVGKALYQWVTDNLDYTIYPGVAPQTAAYPFATWTRVSSVPVNSLCGRLPYNVEYIQVDIYSDSTTEADAKARDFYDFAGYQGTLNGVKVRSVVLTNAFDNFDEIQEGDDEVLPNVTLEFTIQFEE